MKVLYYRAFKMHPIYDFKLRRIEHAETTANLYDKSSDGIKSKIPKEQFVLNYVTQALNKDKMVSGGCEVYIDMCLESEKEKVEKLDNFRSWINDGDFRVFEFVDKMAKARNELEG